MPEMDVTKWVVLLVFAAIMIFFLFNCSIDRGSDKKESNNEEKKE